MSRWTPVDYIVLLLTVVIAVAFVVTAIIPLVLGQPISEARSKVLGGIAVSVVSVISVYVGAKIKGRNDDDS